MRREEIRFIFIEEYFSVCVIQGKSCMSSVLLSAGQTDRCCCQCQRLSLRRKADWRIPDFISRSITFSQTTSGGHRGHPAAATHFLIYHVSLMTSKLMYLHSVIVSVYAELFAWWCAFWLHYIKRLKIKSFIFCFYVRSDFSPFPLF